MIDTSKRKTLMSLGGMMALPFVPGVSLAAYKDLNGINGAGIKADSVDAIGHAINDANLAITLELEGATPFMSITNTSEQLTILRRIHPGIVHMGNKSYDLNSALMSSAYAIGAGLTRRIPIGETSSTAKEPVLAASNARKPLRIASVTSQDASGLLINSSRSYFS